MISFPKTDMIGKSKHHRSGEVTRAAFGAEDDPDATDGKEYLEDTGEELLLGTHMQHGLGGADGDAWGVLRTGDGPRTPRPTRTVAVNFDHIFLQNGFDEEEQAPQVGRGDAGGIQCEG